MGLLGQGRGMTGVGRQAVVRGVPASCSGGPDVVRFKVVVQAYSAEVQTLPISEVRDRLNELVDAAAVTREQVTITKNGSPVAVLIGADEWDSIQETLFWQSQPGIHESIAEAREDVVAGRTYTEEQVRAELDVPRRAR